MSEDSGGKYVCSGGMVISGMLLGSWYAGAATGPLAPYGVLVGAAGGLLWAAAICTRPAIKRLIQRPIDELLQDINAISSLKSELKSFLKESSPDMVDNSDATAIVMLEYLNTNKNEIAFLASSNKASNVSMISGRAKHGLDILKSARPLA